MDRIIIYHRDGSPVKLLMKAIYNLINYQDVLIVGITGESIGRYLIINGKSVPFSLLNL